MKLLTQEIKNRMPKMYSQEGKGDDATVHVKFFTPWSNWTWLATEAALREAKEDDIEDVMFFGLVKGMETELGNFSLRELEEARGPVGLKIERDMHFRSQTLASAKKSERME